MSVRTVIRPCVFCAYPIRFNPTAGELGTFCPRCLRSLSNAGGRPPVGLRVTL